MTREEYSKQFEQLNKERWVGLTCPVFYGKPEDVPAQVRHRPYIVATITIKNLEETIRDAETKKTAVPKTPSA